ncbi:hypothetical protein VCR4J2_750470 [Vibrio coralliirubri]|nr:hypothetical protein VCR4J2_750470 [Vibrio coralliirubri]
MTNAYKQKTLKQIKFEGFIKMTLLINILFNCFSYIESLRLHR